MTRKLPTSAPDVLTPNRRQEAEALAFPLSLVSLLPPDWPLDTPLVRIHTCGCSPVVIEVLQGFDAHLQPIYAPPDDTLWKLPGMTTAPLLLEMLASRPRCVISQDRLMQGLRQRRKALPTTTEDDEDDRVFRRPENVVTLLRKLLYPPALQHLPVSSQRAIRLHLVTHLAASQESGSSYRLARAPMVWLDVEAMEAHAKQIPLLTKFGSDALRTWQSIAEIGLRGPFLPHEGYSDWARWRQIRVSELLWQSVDAQQQRFRLQEDQPEGEEAALRLLFAFWQGYPANQDAFCLLAELLGKRERFQQAEECYAQLCAALELEGREPHERTVEVIRFVRAIQIQRKGNEQASLVPPSPTQKPKSTMLILPYIRESHLTSENEEREDLKISRREIALFSQPNHAFIPRRGEQIKLSGIDEKTLLHFGELTETCLCLSEGSQLGIAEQILWSYLPTLEVFARHSSKQQKLAANIAAQGYLIAASLVGHRNDLVARQHFSEQALLYGEIAQDPNLQVAALRQLAVTFEYWKRPQDVLRIYLQALPALQNVAPRLRSCIYAALSGVYAQMKKKQEADRFIGFAYDNFSEKQNNEPHFLRLINAHYHTIVLWDSLNHLELGQPHQAEQILTQINALETNSGIPERIRIELLNYQAETFVAVSDMERACAYLEITLEASAALGSTRRLQEAFVIFQKAREMWPHEQQIRHLGDLFIKKTIDQMK